MSASNKNDKKNMPLQSFCKIINSYKIPIAAFLLSLGTVIITASLEAAALKNAEKQPSQAATASTSTKAVTALKSQATLKNPEKQPLPGEATSTPTEAVKASSSGAPSEDSCSQRDLLCVVSKSKALGQVQTFAVIFAAAIFILESAQRRKQTIRQAWQLIDGAQGSETSGARKQAIEELCEEGEDILRQAIVFAFSND